MEKTNDTMTMVTLGKTITISQADYTDLIEIKTKYEALVEVLCSSMKLAPSSPLIANVTIDHNMLKAILTVLKALEPNAYNWRERQIRHDTQAGGES